MKKFIKKTGDKFLIQKEKEEQLLLEKFNSMEIDLEKNAKLTIWFFPKKGWKKEKTVVINLLGENTEIKFFAVIIGEGKDSYKLKTTINHLNKNSKSLFHIRSVMQDESKIIYKGNIHISKKSKNSKAQLEHKTLLNSPYAKALTIPSLEILNKEVEAGHSASIGELDHEIIHYLECRGISEEQAKELLLESFLMEGIEQ